MRMDHDDGALTRLPAGLIDRWTRPFAYFLRIEAATGSVLLVATIVALALTNSPWTHQFLDAWETPLGVRLGSVEFIRTLREWINDGLMTLFFFVVALELKRELVLGELRSARMASLSIAAALGGMLVPAALYVTLQFGQPGAHGWGTVMATDTAFVIGALALLGSRIPTSLRVFMLSLAIVDDLGAILVLVIGYGGQIHWGILTLSAVGLAGMRGMAQLGVRSIAVYLIIGVLIWVGVDASGIHPTVTGVVLGLLTPTRRWVSNDRLHAILNRVTAYPAGERKSDDKEDRSALRLAKTAVREALSPVEQLEVMLHPWVGFGVMPLFALANAGLPIALLDLGSPITVAVFVGFALGKPIGIVTFGWLAVRSGIAVRPPSLGWGMLAAGGMLAGIGFTMALFIANLAFDPAHINAAKLGILLASVFSAVAGMTLLTWLTRRERQRHPAVR
jgi:Na+:H+ antiporter, NhaA family